MYIDNNATYPGRDCWMQAYNKRTRAFVATISTVYSNLRSLIYVRIVFSKRFRYRMSRFIEKQNGNKDNETVHIPKTCDYCFCE